MERSLADVLDNGTDREKFARHDEIMAEVSKFLAPYVERDRARRENMRTCRTHNERRKSCLQQRGER